MWIVCHHMAPREPASTLDGLMIRVDVAVEFFVLLSGFLTHHLNCHKDITSKTGNLLQFYARRFFRSLLAAYVGMVGCVFFQWYGGVNIWTSRTLGCFLFSKSWFDPMPDCPDMPSWFVASLMPSWLLYPFILQPVLTASEQRFHGSHLYLALVAWLFAIGPQLCLIFQRSDWLAWEQVKYTWFWPPALLPDFALGACMSVLVQKSRPGKLAALFGDIAMCFLLITCLLVPIPKPPADWAGPSQWRPGHYIGWEQLAARLSAPLMCLFIYGSSGGGSCLGHMLSHQTLVALGGYTLEVYLLQMPLHDIFLWLRPAGGGGLWRGLPWTVEVFQFYVVLLWLSCGLFVEFVAEPLNQSVRRCTASWADKSLSQLAGCRDGYTAVADS
eukprot:TRINITY_DN103146_c0_g1_i1.p1 TRINITY_DN103146_c0_g1~~TRINITY_DN103146_c0_g1_i1.p1  ORF type:complete len:444 (-),score=40.15 TRINITY_DN103146_c0_g1_i1:160-1314(-)